MSAVAFLDHNVTILRFNGRRGDIAYAEYAGRQDIMKHAGTVAERIAYWESLHQAALNVEESRKFLQDLVNQFRD